MLFGGYFGTGHLSFLQGEGDSHEVILEDGVQDPSLDILARRNAP
jgi:hypothetical protein